MLVKPSTPDPCLISKRTSPLEGHPHSGPRIRVSNINKWNMIDYITNNHLTVAQAAIIFNMSESFVRSILKNKELIKEIINKPCSCWKTRKITKYDQPTKSIEENTIEWIDNCNNSISGVSVTYSTIRLFALQQKYDLLNKLNHDDAIKDFECSDGWIERMCKRHNMQRYFRYGYEKEVNLEVIKPKMQEIVSKIDKIDPKYLLNLDETAL